MRGIEALGEYRQRLAIPVDDPADETRMSELRSYLDAVPDRLGTAPLIAAFDQDTFERADVPSGWGTSADGETWNQTFSALPSLVNKSGQVTGSGTSGGGGGIA